MTNQYFAISPIIPIFSLTSVCLGLVFGCILLSERQPQEIKNLLTKAPGKKKKKTLIPQGKGRTTFLSSSSLKFLHNVLFYKGHTV